MKRLNLIFALMLGLSLPMCAQHIDLSDSVVTGPSEYVNLVRLMQKVWTFNHEIPQEKVYLHLDNTGYFKGEKIWFKGYVIRTDTGKPTDLSSVLYAELLNPSGEVIQTKKVYIEKGQAVGDFSLDTLYTTGFYEVRAYTRYMLNWGGTGIFSRVLPIFKQPKEEGDYSKMEIDKFSYRNRQPNFREVPYEVMAEENAEKNRNLLTMKRLPRGKVHVNFYPEGGNLVEDLPARVAFAVNDDEGRDFDVEGVILDENKELMQGAVTFRNGRGYFDLTPDDEPKYLQLTTADGKKQEFELPEALPEGISLMLNTLDDAKVTAKITASLSMQNRLLGYTLMHDGRILYCDTMTCREQMVLPFPREELPGGVNQLTVFDPAGRVLAERLFFICPKISAEDRVTVSTPTDHLVPCGKVRLDIQAQPNANLSFSAMDIATMTNGKEGNALTWMLLSSEVKGYIAHPEYYFESDDREHRVAADLLMMVQGWRRYRWGLMAGNERFKQIHHIEDKLYIQGHLMDAKKDIPVTNEKLRTYLFWADRGAEIASWLYGDCVTDSVGHFAFAMPNAWFEWNMQLIVRDAYDFGLDNQGKYKGAKLGKDDWHQDYRLMIDRNFSPQARWISPEETDTLSDRITPNLYADVPDSVFEALKDMPILKREHVLPEVKVKARRRIYDGARAAWESESHGQRWASIYYNVDREVDRIYDNGGVIPGVYEWLYERNPLFRASGTDRYLPTQLNSNIESVHIDGERTVKVNEYGNPFENLNAYKDGTIYQVHAIGTTVKRSKQGAQIYDDGLSYKGRPIIWILNNSYAGITSTTHLIIRDLMVHQATIEDFPIFLDEVKSIYLTENVNAADRYVYSSDLKGRSPVTIFIYTHHQFPWKKNGLRRTHFQAFDKPDTFKMDDYSKLPPMEDFRRTVFWTPDVKTDENGHATVEFYNNSSARRLYISAEGMTEEGRILTNE